MLNRLISAITWLLVAGSVAIIAGGLSGRPILLASVPTPSMVPTLMPGDLILVLPLFGTDLQEGQIVVFKTETDSTWIVHRIVSGNEQDGFVTKGDANTRPDPNKVFRRHIAGTVPAVGTQAVRVPKAGTLSLDRSPLSNPLVAGLALILGVYLLAADAGGGFRHLRLVKLRRLRVSPVSGSTALGLYLGLGAAVFVVTLMSTWGLSSSKAGTYKVVASQSTSVRIKNVYTVGSAATDTMVLRNPSIVPLVIALDSSDPQMTWEPNWVVVPPHQTREATLTLNARTPGDYRPIFRQSAYLPLLPVPVLKLLSAMQWYLPAFAVAMVPVLVVALVACSDSRVVFHTRLAWLRFRMRLQGRRGQGA